MGLSLDEDFLIAQGRFPVLIIVLNPRQGIVVAGLVKADGGLVIGPHFKPQAVRPTAAGFTLCGFQKLSPEALAGLAWQHRQRIEPGEGGSLPEGQQSVPHKGFAIAGHQKAQARALGVMGKRTTAHPVAGEGGLFQGHKGVEIGRAGRSDAKGHAGADPRGGAYEVQAGSVRLNYPQARIAEGCGLSALPQLANAIIRPICLPNDA